MKRVFFIISVFLSACGGQNTDNAQLLQNRVDSLETKLAETYKPDFGEFMIDIQVHHSKLWFAGKNQNWNLANFEVKKMKETIDDLVKYQSQRKEITIMGMLDRSLDSVRVAIEEKDMPQFKTTYGYLTNTCNICHRSYDVGFNVIKIPESSPFSNQEFQPIE